MKAVNNRCRICNLPDTIPTVHLSKDNICNLCANPKKDHKYLGITQLKKDTNKLLKNSKSKYDCVVGYSGGRDSTYLLYLVKNVLKLNALAVTVVNDFMPKSTIKNINDNTNMLGVDLITINNTSLNKHCRECVKAWAKKPTAEMLLTFCTGCRCVVYDTIPKYANKHKIPLVFIGSAPYEDFSYRTDLLSINPNIPSVSNKIIGYVKQILYNPIFLLHPLSIITQMKEFIRYGNFKYNDITIIKPFYNYIEWKDNEVNNVLEKMHWNKDKFFISSHRADCYISYIRQYYYKRMLGYNDLDVQIATLLRNNKITHDEAIKRLQNENVYSVKVVNIILKKYFGCNYDAIENLINSRI